MSGERSVQIEKKDWRGESRGEGKEKKEYGKKEDVAKQVLIGNQVSLSVNVISVGVLWTDVVVGREYCWFSKGLKNIAAVKHLDWRKK